MAVMTTVGLTELTLIPFGPNSPAKHLIDISKAAFEEHKIFFFIFGETINSSNQKSVPRKIRIASFPIL